MDKIVFNPLNESTDDKNVIILMMMILRKLGGLYGTTVLLVDRSW